MVDIYLFHRSVRVRYRKELYRCPNRLENFVDEQVHGDADDVGNFHLKKSKINCFKKSINYYEFRAPKMTKISPVDIWRENSNKKFLLL